MYNQILICFLIDWYVYLCLTTDIYRKSFQKAWIEINFGIGKFGTLRWGALHYWLILIATFAYESRKGLNFERKLNLSILSSYVVLASDLLVKKIEKGFVA